MTPLTLTTARTLASEKVLFVIPESLSRLVLSSLLLLAGTAVVLALMRRPKSEKPVTWAAAMAGAVGVWALFILAYGIVPHEFLTYADNVLKWREDRIMLDHIDLFGGIDSPIEVSARSVRDILAGGIYGGLATGNILLWSLWQKRKPAGAPTEQTPQKATPEPAGVSAFGRPVAKQV